MALDFTKTITKQQTQTAPIQIVQQDEQFQPPAEMVNYDIVEDRSSMNQLVGSEEIDRLVSTIALDDTNTIVQFGQESAQQIAQVSDAVLRGMSLEKIEGSSQMLKALSTVMSKFDIEEIKDDNKGFLKKLFSDAKKQLSKILEKYHTMGDEVDKIYIELKKYEDDIMKSNQYLEQMFKTNVETYHELVKYILAGEQGCEELRQYIAQREADYNASGDQSMMFEISSLKQSLELLEQRTQDLRTAENVALQSIPMLKTMEFSNLNLVRKINSAFIITLPIFKQALAQAMLLKQQKMQAEALSALDEKTNEMLLKNAKNTVQQAQMTARMSSTSSIKAETLVQTWNIINDGIKETQRIQEEAMKSRESDKVKLQQIKADFSQKYGGAERMINGTNNYGNLKELNKRQ